MNPHRSNIHYARQARRRLALALTACVGVLTGCHWDMWDNSRLKPLEAETFFGVNASSSRTLLAESVPYKQANLDTIYFAGKNADGSFATQLPDDIQLTRELLLRGMERFAIYCTPCHGYRGEGNGMVVQRGFPVPPSFSIDRLRVAEVGYFYDVMTNGFGRMYSYASRIPVHDRWAIAAYIKALQLSQTGSIETLTPEKFEAVKQHALNPPAPASTGGHGDAQGAVEHDTETAPGHGAEFGEPSVTEPDHGEPEQPGSNDGSQH